jgi:CheY-like chemotaxis protein
MLALTPRGHFAQTMRRALRHPARRVFGERGRKDVPDGTIPEPGSHSHPAASNPAAQHKILVVEDEAIVALDLMSTLRQMGYAIAAHALSGEEAIREAASTHPDLVLMDIRLKGLIDGIEAAQQIRARLRGIPVIFLTAFVDEDTLQRVQSMSLGAYLRKPYSRWELQAAIEHVLG